MRVFQFVPTRRKGSVTVSIAALLGLLALMGAHGVAPQEIGEVQRDSLGTQMAQTAGETDPTAPVSGDSSESKTRSPAPFRYRKLDSIPFHVGERFHYVVRYGVISAGSAELGIPEAVFFNGRQCYRIVSEIRSGRFFSAFFRVKDYLESIVDAEGIYPWRFEKHLREGKYRADVEAIYDHQRGLAFVNEDTIRIPAYVQDVLSVFYYVRTQPLDPDRPIIIDNHDNKKVFKLGLRILRKERKKVRAGEFETVVVEPYQIETGKQAGLFREKGRAWIWFTDDDLRIPVLIKSQVTFGSLTLELEKMEGVAGAW